MLKKRRYFLLVNILILVVFTSCWKDISEGEKMLVPFLFTTIVPPSENLYGWQLNSSNTGLAGVGIDKNALSNYTGSGTPASGTVISLKKITIPLWLINGNITLDRCWYQPTYRLTNDSILTTYDFNDGWTPAPSISHIYDCDIDGTAISASLVAGCCGMRGLANMLRNNVYGMGTGIAIFSYALEASCLIENNYVHDLRAYGDSHNESGTIRSFNPTNDPSITNIWRNNWLESMTGSDSGALFGQPYSTDINNVYIEGNYLKTYNYCVVIGTYGSNTYRNYNVNNNRFEQVGFGPFWVNYGPGFATWTENYYNNSANPDNKGSVINWP